ncbi:hypothetical protein L5515_015272 [Caenorhabditis briggsae]|uniref:Uncharacterized protein n=1 Tax=Caenorhabditis briggsae TaxID=6238 RepID=A0AAE9J9S3_CAEBR|nr:hypothetical protein L5515_015272 [Caenorhabditis briggsae]
MPVVSYPVLRCISERIEANYSALESWGIGLVKLHLLIESPLKELRLRVSHPTVFENLIARTAEKLVIMCDGYDEPDTRLETHRNLLNKEVIIDTFLHDFTDIRIMELIEYWRETFKAVGSSFSVRKVNGDPIEMFLEKVKERFEGTYLKLEQTDTNTFFDVNAVSIKIDSESKIVVYGGRTYRTFPIASKVVIKVMAIGSFEEVLEPPKKSNNIPRKLFNYALLFVLTLSNPNNNAVSVKIDSESEIVIYGISSRWAFPKVVMKVVAVGSSANISKTVVEQNLAHERLSCCENSKKSNIIPRKLSSNSLSALFLISLLAFLIALCLWFLC